MRFLRRAISTATLGLLATLAAVASAAPEAPPPAKDPLQPTPIITATRQNAFTIPFRIEPVQNPAQQPVEVELHVSTDQGAHWESAGRVKPDKGAFVFRAPHDGEYWFSIRTLDGQGAARPEALDAQLQVTVDTIAPRLELTAVRGEGGEIVARWQAVDPNLKPSSFKLEYQLSSSGIWQQVAVDAPSEAMRHTLTGETRFWPKEPGAILFVRAEITDTAGNPAVNQAIVKADSAAAPTAGVPSQTVPSQTVPSQSMPTAPPLGAAAQNSSNPSAAATRWPAERLTGEPLARTLGSEPQTGSVADDSAWRTGNQNATAQPVSRSSRTIGQPEPAARADAAHPQMINAHNFELEYEIDSVGPSGVGKVELWGTRDGGRTWASYGVDNDQRSPISVAVDGEGLYGFRVAVQSGNGLGGRPPAAGELPDIWLGVDLTRPVCRITAADVDLQTGELVIGWTASDNQPEPRPITLSYSAALQGPWTPIATGLENSGSYRWRLDSRVPDPVYVRLEMRDAAGNVGSFETADPVSLDRHRPEGRIRGVRPLGR